MNDNKDLVDKKEDFGTMIISSVLTVVILLLVVFLFKVIFDEISSKTRQKNIERKEILSINISNKAEGSFVLGVGTVKNKEYYIAYEVLKDNGKKLVKIPIDNSVIYDILEDEENAYIEIVTNGLRQEVETKIYVPKGTITKEYDMSLE